MPSVSGRAARQAPRSLNSRMMSPSSMPRAAASLGCMRATSRPRCLASGCGRRNRAGCAAASRLVGDELQRGVRRVGARRPAASQVGWPGQSASPKPAMVSEKISILPLGVGSGLRLGIVAERAQRAAVVRPAAADSHSPAPRIRRSSARQALGRQRLRGSARRDARSHCRDVRPSVKASRAPSRSARPAKIA